MKIRSLITVVAMSAMLAGCLGNKQTGGALIGGGAGALIGSQIGGGRGQLVAVAIGALAGAFIGSEVGKSLDRADRLAIQQTTQHALESAPVGRSVAWSNPDRRRQTYGSVTPTSRAYPHRGYRYCREYQQKITVDGKTERAYGRACRQPDGSWKIVNR